MVLTTSYPHGRGVADGHFVQAEARVLQRSGARVEVISAGGRYADAARVERGVRVWSAGGGDAFRSPGIATRMRQQPWRGAALASFALGTRRRLAALGEIDEIVAHWLLPCAWPLALRAAPRLVGIAHGADVRLLLALPASLRSRLIQALLLSCTQLRFVAHALLDELCARLPAELAQRLRQRAQVAPCAIEIELPNRDDAAVRRSLRVPFDAPLVVAVARLVASKRIDLLLCALARLPTTVHVVIVGDGPERETLEALSAQLGLRQVHFVGAMSRPRTLGLIAAADVLVSCSAHEGAPTVVREARALATQVIATPAGDLARWAVLDPGIKLVTANPNLLAESLSAALV